MFVLVVYCGVLMKSRQCTKEEEYQLHVQVYRK